MSGTVRLPATAAALLVLALLSSQAVPAQTNNSKRKRSLPAAVGSISDKDWGLLAGALSREEWGAAERLTQEFLSRLKSENDMKQMAQLRYLRLYSLAGKLNALISGRNDAAAPAARETLKIEAARFADADVVMPARELSVSCRGKVNFICPVKENPKALRITATNKDGDAILSFDYVLFDEAVKLSEFEGRKVFVGGRFDRIELNDDPAKPWVMRLFLKNGFARINVGD